MEEEEEKEKRTQDSRQCPAASKSSQKHLPEVWSASPRRPLSFAFEYCDDK